MHIALLLFLFVLQIADYYTTIRLIETSDYKLNPIVNTLFGFSKDCRVTLILKGIVVLAIAAIVGPLCSYVLDICYVVGVATNIWHIRQL